LLPVNISSREIVHKDLGTERRLTFPWAGLGCMGMPGPIGMGHSGTIYKDRPALRSLCGLQCCFGLAFLSVALGIAPTIP
jgi:hypothetical protein